MSDLEDFVIHLPSKFKSMQHRLHEEIGRVLLALLSKYRDRIRSLSMIPLRNGSWVSVASVTDLDDLHPCIKMDGTRAALVHQLGVDTVKRRNDDNFPGTSTERNGHMSWDRSVVVLEPQNEGTLSTNAQSSDKVRKQNSLAKDEDLVLNTTSLNEAEDHTASPSLQKYPNGHILDHQNGVLSNSSPRRSHAPQHKTQIQNAGGKFKRRSMDDSEASFILKRTKTELLGPSQDHHSAYLGLEPGHLSSTSATSQSVPMPPSEESGRKSLPSAVPVRHDPEEMKYFAELYMSEYLKRHLAKDSYQPNEHWTSTLRLRNGLKRFNPVRKSGVDFSAFTLIPQEGEVLRDSFCKASGIADSALTKKCVFHIEVCATERDMHTIFQLPNAQFKKAQRFSLSSIPLRRSPTDPNKTNVSNVFILALVYNVLTTPGIVLYADPWRLHLEDHISLESDHSFRCGVSKKAPKMLSEEVFSEKMTPQLPGIYKSIPINVHKIRLLQLKLNPDEGEEAPLRCDLITMSTIGPQRFWAISYVWGPAPSAAGSFWLEVTVKVDKEMINTVKIPITESLWGCLRSLRRQQVTVPIWADAVCINQEDNVEKAMQVRRMGNLYWQAERVIIWMGNGTKEDEDLINSFRQSEQRQSQARTLLGPRIDSFLQKRWFTRTWTVQELVFGSEVQIMCGKSEIKWDLFMKNIRAYQTHTDANGGYVLKNTHAAMALDDTRRKRQASAKDHDILFRRTRSGFLEVLEKFFYTKSSRPRDKLFALLNLAHNSDFVEFQPDYSSKEQEITWKYAERLVKERHALDLLYRAGHDKGSNFGSWIPDLMNHRDMPHYAATISTWKASGPEGGFSAGHGATPSATFLYEKPRKTLIPVLRINGVVIDWIQSCQPLSIGQLDQGNLLNNAYNVVDDFSKFISFLKMYPIYINREWKKHLIVKCLIGDSGGPQGEWVSGMQNEEWPEALADIVDEFHKNGINTGHPDMPLLEQFWNTVQAFLSRVPQAKLCTTRRGFVGVVPGVAKGGDQIFVAHGAKVPFLIRNPSSRGRRSKKRRGNDEGIQNSELKRYHTFIGEAYIHGVMYHGKGGPRQDEEICLV